MKINSTTKLSSQTFSFHSACAAKRNKFIDCEHRKANELSDGDHDTFTLQQLKIRFIDYLKK